MYHIDTIGLILSKQKIVMKKFKSGLIMVLALFIAFTAKSQKSGADYFLGKWNLLVKGLPDGDTKMSINLEKKDTAYVGAISDSTGKEISKFSKVELKDTTVTVFFTAQGYDVFVRLDKKGDDHVEGTMLEMFETVGDRAKKMGTK